MNTLKTPASLLFLTMALIAFAGCDALAARMEELASSVDPEPAATEAPPEAPEEELPERPPTSTARSETEVITFQSVLENTAMTREERIQAFENLDPGALQRPVARANVSAGKRSMTPGSPGKREPANWEIAAARRRVPVTMYSTAWCGVCKRARSYFEEKRIAFVEHDVDEDRQARAEYERLNPRRSVPTIKIGDEVVIGFSAAAVEKALETAARGRIE